MTQNKTNNKQTKTKTEKKTKNTEQKTINLSKHGSKQKPMCFRSK